MTRDAVADSAVVLVLAGVAAVLRWAALAPDSLWLDDAWAALAHRAGSLREVALTGLTSVGFQGVLKAWFSLVGFSELRAQAIPFLAGLAAPGMLHLVLHRSARLPRSAAAVGGALLVVSPVLSIYSTRVKPFTLDAVLVIALLWTGIRLWRSCGGRGDWMLHTGVALVGTVLSAVTAVAATGGFAAGVLRSRGRAARWAVASVAAYGAFAGIWWAGALRETATNETLRRWWQAREVFASGPADLLGLYARVGPALVRVEGFLVMGAVAACLAVAVWRRRDLAVLVAVPLAGAGLLSVIGLLPLGGGRTDAYLLPLLATMVAAALPAGLAHAWWAAGLALLVASPLLLPRITYPDQPAREVVARLVQAAEGSDAIVVLGVSQYPIGLYWPGVVGLVPESGVGTGFSVRFADPRVTIAGAPWSPGPAAATVRTSAVRTRTWVVATRSPGRVREVVRTVVAAGSVEIRSEWSSGAARLVLLAPGSRP